MPTDELAHIMNQTIGQLSDPASLQMLQHSCKRGASMPNGERLRETVDLCRALIFPGFYGNATPEATLPFHIGVSTERLYNCLSEQIEAAMCLMTTEQTAGKETRQHAKDLAAQFISRLPDLRQLLLTDVEAAWCGDPAAESYEEVVSCYPAIKALTVYRVAHELLTLGVPLIPRILAEMAHSETGIDIHPAATIGSHFTIDHGTGVVIGATCIIGHHVKLYQGVTLGARSFPLDENGSPIKHVARHPILGNHVIVYSNSTILGRVTIGDGAVIGGNVWLTHDVPAGETIRQTPCASEDTSNAKDNL